MDADINSHDINVGYLHEGQEDLKIVSIQKTNENTCIK